MQEWSLRVAFEFNVVAMSNRKCNLKGSVYQRQSSEARPNTRLFSRVAHVACLSSTESKLCYSQLQKEQKIKMLLGMHHTLPFLTAAF